MKSANPDLPLLPREEKPSPSTELVTTAEPTVGELLKAVIDKGDPEKNIGVLERLIALKERADAKQAEREFSAAFAKAQREIGVVQARKPVPGANGTIRYIYAPFEDIMAHAQPVLEANGFAVSFSSEIKEDRITLFCTMSHISGHKQTTQFMARIGNGPPHASPAQADGAAATYAKRRAFCDALNIVAEVDTDGADQDARSLGAPISHEQVQTLKELVKETRASEEKFLKLAGVDSYEKIGTKQYAELFRTLDSRRTQPR